MIENLQTVNVFSPTLSEIILNIFVSLICGFAISLVYRFTYRGPGYSESFVNSIALLAVITTLVIMVIGNNLARAFGLVGALSIIRFRTAIKDTMDIVYIFFSLAIGMASGVGYYKLAVAGTIIVGLILIIFSKDKISFFLTNQYMLQYMFGQPDSERVTKLLSDYCTTYEVINIRMNDSDEIFEYSYYIRVKKNKDVNQLLYDLQKINGIKNLNLFFDQQNS